MFNSEEYCKETWANLDKYVDNDGKLHFVRNRKTTLESIIKYPIYDSGRTTSIDMTNTINTYDRGYDALELMLKHMV